MAYAVLRGFCLARAVRRSVWAVGFGRLVGVWRIAVVTGRMWGVMRVRACGVGAGAFAFFRGLRCARVGVRVVAEPMLIQCGDAGLAVAWLKPGFLPC